MLVNAIGGSTKVVAWEEKDDYVEAQVWVSRCPRCVFEWIRVIRVWSV